MENKITKILVVSLILTGIFFLMTVITGAELPGPDYSILGPELALVYRTSSFLFLAFFSITIFSFGYLRGVKYGKR